MKLNLLEFLKKAPKVLDKSKPNKLFKDIHDPIVVYTMGKVGSFTVYQSLLQSYENPENIFHLHYLNGTINPNNEKNKLLRELYDSKLVKKWKVITLVRDPIARNISAFFENLELFLPNFYNEYKGDTSDFLKLNDTFLKKYPHWIPNKYFDSEINIMLDIDVFSKSFDTSIGHQLYSNSLVDLLVIRLENLSESEKVIGDFLNKKDFKFKNFNIGSKKKYSDIYKMFKEKFIAPDDLIDEMYHQKFGEHFYSQEEIKKFIKKYDGKSK